MNREDFTKELKKILTDNNIGTMTTVRDNKPMSRYMYFYNDGLALYTYTRKGTYKVEDLEKNPNTHILLGYEEREGLRSEEHTSELQSRGQLVCRRLLEKKE